MLLLSIEELKACLSGFHASLRPLIIFRVCHTYVICETLKQTPAFRLGSCCNPNPTLLSHSEGPLLQNGLKMEKHVRNAELSNHLAPQFIPGCLQNTTYKLGFWGLHFSFNFELISESKLVLSKRKPMNRQLIPLSNSGHSIRV